MSGLSYNLSDNDDDLLDDEEEMMEKEEYLIENVSSCLQSKLELIKNNFYALKDTIFEKVVKDSFYNTDAMKVAECTISSLFYVSPYDFGSMALNDKITTYISNLRKIGTESAEGNAFLADFGRTQDLFVVKSAKNPSDDSLIHELVVGLYGTNKLRKFVPNFSYIYGGFKCSPPVISRGMVSSWCNNNNNKVNYVLYENINPSMSLNDFVSRCSGEDFLNVYMQILYALRKGFELIDFTHYDLHTENVLVRGTDYPMFQIPYETETGKEYIQANVIATIIDYGFSHIKTSDMIEKNGDTIPADVYGKFGLEEWQVWPKKSWVLGDMYKLLMMSMERALFYGNDSVINVGRTVYSYFFENDMLVGLEAGRSRYQTLPFKGDVDQKFALNDLAIFIRTHIDSDFISAQSELPILNCETLLCDSEEVIYKKIGLIPREELVFPRDMIEFAVLYERLQNEGRLDDAEILLAGYDYVNNIKMSTLKLDLYTTELSDSLRIITPANVSGITAKGRQYLLKVKQMYYQLVEVFSKIRQIKILYDVCIDVANIYSDLKSIEDIQGIMEKFFASSDDILVNFMAVVNANKLSREVGYAWFDIDRKNLDQLILDEYDRYLSLKQEFIDNS